MDSLETYLIIALGLGAGALCKGVTGMGLPMFAVPVLASFFGIPQAVAIMAVPIIVTNSWQIYHYRSHAGSIDFLPHMAAGGVVGICLGTLFLKTAPGALLEIVFGLLLLSYVALRLVHPSLQMSLATGKRLAAPTSTAAGILQGAVGMAGPVLLTFLNSLRLERGVFIHSISVVFLSYAVVQLAALTVAGLMTGETLLQGLFALLPIAMVMPLGMALGRRISARAFDRVMMVFLVVIALRFLARGSGII